MLMPNTTLKLCVMVTGNRTIVKKERDLRRLGQKIVPATVPWKWITLKLTASVFKFVIC